MFVYTSGDPRSPQAKINLGDEPQVTPIFPPDGAAAGGAPIMTIDPRVKGEISLRLKAVSEFVVRWTNVQLTIASFTL